MSEASEDPTPQPSEPDELPFRPVQYLYAAVLLAWSIITFGGWGLLFGVPVLVVWAYVFASPSRPRALLYVCVVILIGLLFTCLLPAQQAREDAPRAQCKNNLKQFGLAFHNYHDTFGSFPPAYIADKDGRPMHSWRVLLLPYIDQTALYNAYNFDEPWNGPNNSKLLGDMPLVYACPGVARSRSGHGNCTSYVVVVGPRTSSPGSTGRGIGELKDGTTETILVIECNSGDIPWMEPRDLSLDEALDLLTSSEPCKACGHRHDDFFYEYCYDGRNVLLADGSVRYVPHGIDRAVWSSLLRINDGAGWPESDLNPQPLVTQRLKTGNCIRFAVFVLLVLLPLPGVWLNPTSGTQALRDNGA